MQYLRNGFLPLETAPVKFFDGTHFSESRRVYLQDQLKERSTIWPWSRSLNTTPSRTSRSHFEEHLYNTAYQWFTECLPVPWTPPGCVPVPLSKATQDKIQDQRRVKHGALLTPVVATTRSASLPCHPLDIICPHTAFHSFLGLQSVYNSPGMPRAARPSSCAPRSKIHVDHILTSRLSVADMLRLDLQRSIEIRKFVDRYRSINQGTSTTTPTLTSSSTIINTMSSSFPPTVQEVRRVRVQLDRIHRSFGLAPLQLRTAKGETSLLDDGVFGESIGKTHDALWHVITSGSASLSQSPSDKSKKRGGQRKQNARGDASAMGVGGSGLVPNSVATKVTQLSNSNPLVQTNTSDAATNTNLNMSDAGTALVSPSNIGDLFDVTPLPQPSDTPLEDLPDAKLLDRISSNRRTMSTLGPLYDQRQCEASVTTPSSAPIRTNRFDPIDKTTIMDDDDRNRIVSSQNEDGMAMMRDRGDSNSNSIGCLSHASTTQASNMDDLTANSNSNTLITTRTEESQRNTPLSTLTERPSMDDRCQEVEAKGVGRKNVGEESKAVTRTEQCGENGLGIDDIDAHFVWDEQWHSNFLVRIRAVRDTPDDQLALSPKFLLPNQQEGSDHFAISAIINMR